MDRVLYSVNTGPRSFYLFLNTFYISSQSGCSERLSHYVYFASYVFNLKRKFAARKLRMGIPLVC